MNTGIAVRTLVAGAGCALALAGCGGADREAGRPAAASHPAATPDPVAEHGRELIVFRRVRYEGATLNVMTFYADGMSPDLKPLVTRLNAILVGDARGERRVVHRWGSI